MATPGEALATSSSAATVAGAESADSIEVSCDFVRVGVFFDGTGNSRAHVGTRHIDAWHTNVDMLEHRYRKTDAPEFMDVYGERRKGQLGSLYMRGIGIEAGGGNQQGFFQLPYGMAWGTGSEGVRARVDQAIDQTLAMVRDKANGLEPCDVWLDTFGFSRGACASRDFANKVEDGRITHAGIKARVKFMGLFDTVSSIGEPGNSGNWDEDNVKLETHGRADTIFHITAKDELRVNFPLTRSVGKEISMVGVHSDIGGGYAPGTSSGSMAFESSTYAGLKDTLEAKWGLPLGPETSSMGVTTSESAEIHGDQIRSVEQNGGAYGGMNLFAFRWEAEHGLQFVSLRIMHDHATAAQVPFEELGSSIEGDSIAMTPSLSAYYDQIRLPPHRARPEMEMAIRRVYTHMSADDDLIGAHTPEPDGVRDGTTM